MIEWGVLVAAIEYAASVFPMTSAPHRVLAAVGYVAQALIGLWVICQFLSVFERMERLDRRVGTAPAIVFFLALLALFMSVAIVGNVTIPVVIKALATRAAH